MSTKCKQMYLFKLCCEGSWLSKWVTIEMHKASTVVHGIWADGCLWGSLGVDGYSSGLGSRLFLVSEKGGRWTWGGGLMAKDAHGRRTSSLSSDPNV